MNEKRKLLSNFIIFSLFSYLILISCSEDLYDDTDGIHFGRKHSDNVKLLTGNEAKLIFNQLVNESKNNKNFDILGNKLKINGKNSFLLKNSSQTTIDYSQIMQVVDTHGNNNYTFKILNHPDDDENTFHNLVFNNQNTTSPRINLLKYDNVGTNFRTTSNSTATSTSLIGTTDPCDPITIHINPIENNPVGNNPGGGTNPGNTGGDNSNNGGSGSDNNNLNINQTISVIYKCNSDGCNFSSNSWEGFSTHTYLDENGNSKIYDFTIIISRNSSSDSNSTITYNPCDPLGNFGLLPDRNEKLPCEELKKVSDKPAFATNMTVLKNNISGQKEKGFIIRDKEGADAFSQVVEGNSETIPYPYADNTPEELDKTYRSIGTAHNHLATNPKHIGIFTPDDLGNLFLNGMIETNIQNPYKTQSPKKSVIFLITNKGFFALKINDLNKLRNFCVLYGSWTKTQAEDYFKKTFQNSEEYNIRPDSTHDQIVTGFLRFIQDQDIGIDLYEGDSNTFGSFSKLVLNENNGNFSFTPQPCNN